MAKVTITQAYEAIYNGNKSKMAAYGKKYPLAMITLALIVKEGSEAAETFLTAIPDTMSMNRIEKNMEANLKIEEVVDDDDEDEVVEKKDAPVKPQKAAEEDKPKKRRGRPKKTETPVEEIVEPTEEPVEAEEPEVEIEEAEEVTEEASENEYASMNAVELFKLCKSRGIDVMPKKKAAEYIELLEEADAEEAQESGWDENAMNEPEDAGSDDSDEEWDI